MSYLPINNNIALKSNIRALIENECIDTDELLEDLDMTKDELDARLDPYSKREITPDMYYKIHVYLMKNNLDYIELLGDLPEKYGERLKYFVYSHYMTMSEFSRKTSIPTSTLFNLYSGKINISPRYKNKLCIVLTNDEYKKLSSYTDIDLNIERSKGVIDGMNFSYNLYNIKPAFFNPDRLIKALNINNINKDDFYVGKINLTPTRKRKIAEYLKVPIEVIEDLTKDNLELGNPLNKFGYWFALQLYNSSNPIVVFAQRCKLDVQYIADIISGQTLIRDEDIKNIANHLEVEKEALYNAIPHDDEELLPMKKDVKKENNMVTKKKNNSKYKVEISKIIHNKLHMSVKDFCGLVDINYFTFVSAINRGTLPEKNRQVIIKELGLNDDTTIPKRQVNVNPNSIETLKKFSGSEPLKRVPGLGSMVKSKLNEQGTTIKDFSKSIGVAAHTLSTALRRNYLPRGFENIIVEKLDIKDFYLGKQSIVEEQIKEDIEDNQCNPVPVGPFDPFPIEDEIETLESKPINTNVSHKEEDIITQLENTIKGVKALTEDLLIPVKEKEVNISNQDKINILEMFDQIKNYDQQISLIKLICKLSNLEVDEELERQDIIGVVSRMSLLNNIIK